ncbi:hypothetical protein BJY04DRAFT_200029 [Aspergillus karnatakaensis]|uniref:uncharacterized protein n=1 Tax=Aspergillus karnatakaensis TaxID=1810916 RepID=UPI003CCE2F36
MCPSLTLKRSPFLWRNEEGRKTPRTRTNMYPWKEGLDSWAHDMGVRIDALGLVTLLGAEEMDRSIGRLMPSAYFDYLPLLGAFTIAGNRFVEKTPGFTMYNISAGIMTTELAGWFSRWLRAQDLKQVRSIVTWSLVDGDSASPPWRPYHVWGLLIAVPVHGFLIALSLLTGDWWGFANVVSMLVSVVVRCLLVGQNQAGIDANIAQAEEEEATNKQGKKQSETRKEGVQDEQPPCLPPSPSPLPRDSKAQKKDGEKQVTVLVVTDDSKIVTVRAPGFLIRPAFTTRPAIQKPNVYLAYRSIGWIAFAVHVISIGMAAFYTQIFSVALIIIATVLTAYRVGCADSLIARTIRNRFPCCKPHTDNAEAPRFRVTSRLMASVSTYPAEYSEWEPSPKREIEQPQATIVRTKEEGGSPQRGPFGESPSADLEKAVVLHKTALNKVPERRRDLYVWLDLTPEEEELMVAWALMPRSQKWMQRYFEMKAYHSNRIK